MDTTNWTERAKKALALGRQWAGELGHEYIGTEHLLWGVLEEGGGVAVMALKEMGASKDKMSARLQSLVQSSGARAQPKEDELTPRARRALDMARNELSLLGHSFIGTEHLLLGLLWPQGSVANHVLDEAGITLEGFRERLRKLLEISQADRARREEEDEIREALVRFWSQFGVLQHAGVPVLTSLTTQRREARLPPLQQALDSIVAAVRQGKPLHLALAANPSLFSVHVQELVRVSAEQGSLDVVCNEIAQGLKSGTLPVSSAGGKATAAEAAATAEEKPVADLAQETLREAIAANASDIHLEPTAEGGQLRLRVDGVMIAPKPINPEQYDALISRFQLMARVDVAEKNLPQDSRIQLEIDERPLNLRASFMRFQTGGARGHGYGVVIRILLPQAALYSLEELDAPEEMRLWPAAPWGVHIISGPTGSGKTTVLYSLLKRAATPGRKVLAAENPVEYLIPGVLQAEVRHSIGLTFSALVRSFMRQDPDVIMIGDVRDHETAVLLPNVALTGHLLFTQLHTVSSTEIPRRLIDLGLEPWLVQETLKGAASMRLLRCLCRDCRVPDERDLSPLLDPLPYAQEFRGVKFFRTKGCPACRDTGCRGRMAVYEVLPITDRVREAIAKNLAEPDLRRIATEEGLITLRHAALRKAAEGATGIDEALRVTAGNE
jgi:type IV pilus assembly protein PilB